ncbi:hypothetical protein PACTADRAFT_34481 [Pachysolen tannophilus NRRL Y-2460]|uniref:Mto2p-binding domain-containing protein n=1 Tax=Pachysolen tannophilus NRRL Y-2460 TaxID=669874 RepID=A0A1E4TSL0_PACTA|nr:hypothetical protein PACTADRAFT_34481 [Pachysolen tannophilus NRRL Y-2460]
MDLVEQESLVGIDNGLSGGSVVNGESKSGSINYKKMSSQDEEDEEEEFSSEFIDYPNHSFSSRIEAPVISRSQIQVHHDAALNQEQKQKLGTPTRSIREPSVRTPNSNSKINDFQLNKTPTSSAKKQYFDQIREKRKSGLFTSRGASRGASVGTNVGGIFGNNGKIGNIGNGASLINLSFIDNNDENDPKTFRDMTFNNSNSEDDELDIDKTIPELPKIENNNTPWRQKQNNIISSRPPNFDLSALTSSSNNNNHNNNLLGNSVNNAHEAELLRKKVTGYQLQIKLIMDFLKKNGKNDLLEKLEMQTLMISSPISSCKNCDLKDNEINQLKNNLIILKENYHKIKSQFKLFQEKMTLQEKDWGKILENMSTWENLIENALILLSEWTTDKDQKNTILKIRGQNTSLDEKLQVLLFAIQHKIDEVINNEDFLKKQIETLRQNNVKENEIETVKVLLVSLKSLQKQLAENREQTENVERSLEAEISHSSKLSDAYNDLRNSYIDKDSELLKLKKQCNNRSERIKKLLSTISNLEKKININGDIINSNSHKEVVNLQNELDNLKIEHSREVEQLKKKSIIPLSSDETELKLKSLNNEFSDKIKILEEAKANLSAEVLSNQKEINRLNHELNQLQSTHDDKLEELLSKNQHLQDTLQEEQELNRSQKQELSTANLNNTYKQREHEKIVDNLKRELTLAVEKQRTLSAEKSRLRHRLESMSKDKKTLETNIDILKSKVGDLENLNQQLSSESTEIYEYWHTKYEEFLNSDSKIVSKFLKSFEKILDTNSISQAKGKIDQLLHREEKSLDEIQVKELHESIFHYYVSAVETIVTEHVTLLLNTSETQKTTESNINQLKQQIADLKQENHVLQDKLNSNDTNNNNNVFSAVSDGEENKENRSRSNTQSLSASNEVDDNIDSLAKLRIEELSKRWKTEREARVIENENAKVRLRELEIENAALKEKIT